MECRDWDLLVAGAEQAHNDRLNTPRPQTPPQKVSARGKSKGRPARGTRRRGRPRIPDSPMAQNKEDLEERLATTTTLLPSPQSDIQLLCPLPSLPARAQRLLNTFVQEPIYELRGFRIRYLPIFIASNFEASVIYSVLAAVMNMLRICDKDTGRNFAPAFKARRDRQETVHLEDEILSYHSKAVRAVRTQLADPAHLHQNQESVVATIMGLAMYSRMVQDHGVLRVHLLGVKEIVQPRGGVGALSACQRMLIFMIDTHSASMRDVRPIFAIPTDLLPTAHELQITVSDVTQETTLAWLRRWPSRMSIAVIMNDVARVTAWIVKQAEQDPDFYEPNATDVTCHWLMPLMHRCLQLLPQQLEGSAVQSCEEEGWAFQEAVRHGLILFLNRFRRLFLHVAIETHTARINQLKSLLLDLCPPNGWDGMESLLIFVIIVGGMEAERLSDQISFEVPPLA